MHLHSNILLIMSFNSEICRVLYRTRDGYFNRAMRVPQSSRLSFQYLPTHKSQIHTNPSIAMQTSLSNSNTKNFCTLRKGLEGRHVRLCVNFTHAAAMLVHATELEGKKYSLQDYGWKLAWEDCALTAKGHLTHAYACCLVEAPS